MLVLTDVELVEAAQSGDEKAFETLVEKHRARIDATISSFIKNPQDQEDIAQETFINAYRNLHQLSKPDSFSYWLVTIAQNLCRNWLNKHQNHTIPIDEVNENLLNSDNSPDREVIETEQHQIITQAIKTLPESERQIASAHYLEGESHEELVNRHGISYQAVCVRLSRAKQKLAKRLGHLLTGVFAFPASTLKQIYSGGLTVMKVGTVPKIAAGAVVIIVLAFIGTRHFISSKENSSPSVEVATSTPNEPANSVAQTNAARKNSVTAPSREGKPQIPAAEMQQIEDFFAQLESADAQSEIDSSQLPTDAASGQDSESGDTNPSVVSEDPSLSAEEVMNAFVEAFRNLDFEVMSSLMTGVAKEGFDAQKNGFVEVEIEVTKEVEIDGEVQPTEEMTEEDTRQMEEQMLGPVLEMINQVEVVSSEHSGDEFHFRLKLPAGNISAHMLEILEESTRRSSLELAESGDISETLITTGPDMIEMSDIHVKMRKENGAWRIYEIH